MKSKLARIGLAVGVVVLWHCSPAPDVNGTWEVTVVNTRGTFRTTFAFAQVGSSLSGYASSPLGDREEIKSGRAEGGRIEFTVLRVNPSGEPAPVAYKGTVTGDEIKGTFRGPGGNEVEWTAKRVKPPDGQGY